MGETEITIFLIIASLILLVFIGGIVIFILQYYRRKLLHEREKNSINEQHAYELLTARLEMQQQTMQDIGREIHDNVGQKLTLASIYINQLVYEQRHAPEQIAAAGGIIDESLQELRSLSRNLTNSFPEAITLRELIENECQKIQASGICTVNRTFSGSPVMGLSVARNFMLRIVQEFLQNSLKHSRCTVISLQYEHNETGLQIHMQDNGIGFAMESACAREGIGLSNMKKRAELMGAAFRLYSTPGNGTTADLFIPSDKL